MRRSTQRFSGLTRRRLLGWGAVASLGVLPACAPRRDEAGPELAKTAVVPQWPPPPAPPRFRYQTALRSSADVHLDSDTDRLRGLLGGAVNELVPLDKPYGVAARGGTVYVSDTVRRVIHAFDAARRRYFQFGFRREGTLRKPLGLTTDDSRRVYVADATGRRVVMFDALGLYLGELGDPQAFAKPVDVAVAPVSQRVYIVDLGGVQSTAHRVLVYGADGKQIFAFGTRGRENGQFNLPVGICVAPDGTVYVLDAGNFRVQAFSPDGEFLHAWGGLGRALGQFARPKAIAIDGDGRVYVADAAFGNVQIFDPEGRLLLPLGQVSRTDAPGRYGLLSGVATDELGFVYMLDQAFRKIEIIRYVHTA